jgi:hypothetical protein
MEMEHPKAQHEKIFIKNIGNFYVGKGIIINKKD